MAEFIVSILVGVLGIILSICVKKYKMTSLIAGFNPKKHDEEKIATIVGDNIFLVGLVIIFFAIVRIVVPEYESILYIAETLSIVALVIKIIYCTNKYALKENL